MITFYVLEFIAFSFTVVGNVIVIYVMTRGKKLQRRSNIYILSVAVADLMMGTLVIPITIANVS